MARLTEQEPNEFVQPPGQQYPGEGLAEDPKQLKAKEECEHRHRQRLVGTQRSITEDPNIFAKGLVSAAPILLGPDTGMGCGGPKNLALHKPWEPP